MEDFGLIRRVMRYGLIGGLAMAICSLIGNPNSPGLSGELAYWLLVAATWIVLVVALIIWRQSAWAKRLRADIERQHARLNTQVAQTKAEREALRQAAIEAVQGMPALNQTLREYYKSQDENLSAHMKYTTVWELAQKAAEAERVKMRYEAQLNSRELQAKIDLYETIDPGLKDYVSKISRVQQSGSLLSWLQSQTQHLNYERKTKQAALIAKERELEVLRQKMEDEHRRRILGGEENLEKTYQRNAKKIEQHQQKWEEKFNQRSQYLESDYQRRREDLLTEHSAGREEDKRVLARALATTQQEREVLRAVARTHNAALPALLAILDELAQAADREIVAALTNKANPARTTAERVREEAVRRREAEKNARYLSVLVEYYENLAPFLTDFREELTAERSAEEEAQWFEAYTDEERQDLTTKFLTKEEYRKLTSAQRSDKALERYWARRHSPQEIGRMYERYVGYLYEMEGFRVEYHGILYGKEDLGRDLLCYGPDGHTRVVQCKWWSQQKTIHEKHLFQLYGSLFLYQRQIEQQGLFEAQGVFVTTTQLSDVAREAAQFLRIEVMEQKPMDKEYPCIKCNVSRTGEKIYHLPFDQQYDKTRIIPKNGEMYCKTAAEAEKKGFRRALRYRPE